MQKKLEVALKQVCDALENLLVEYEDSVDFDDANIKLAAMVPAQRALEGARRVMQGTLE